MKLRCPDCGNTDLYCRSPAVVYQRTMLTAEGGLDFEAYETDDIEFTDEGQIVCLDCLSSSIPESNYKEWISP